MWKQLRNYWNYQEDPPGKPDARVDAATLRARPKPKPKTKLKPRSRTASGPQAHGISAEEKAELCKALAAWFVRKDNKFLLVERPDHTISRADIERASLHRFGDRYPGITLTPGLLKEVFQHGIEAKHNDPEQSIQVWNGHFACRPDLKNRLIPNEGFVTINSWRTPKYRCIGETRADSSLLDELLERALAHQPDRIVVKDWLAWCLQNEANKPGWALFLYSRRKGTGKSTLCQFATRLFGEDNSMTQNSVEKLTGRFNMPILQSKLVISEELMLKPGSTQGNTLKTYITEEETASEIKGQEVQRVRQCCCFLFTSNHMPLWIEADDRRYYVVDADHEGHASGPASAEFGAFVRRFREGMADDRVMAQVYNSLMQHQVSEGFDAKSLNLAKDSNPLMQQIQGASRQVLLDQLEEYLDGSGSFAIPQETLTTLFREEFRANSNQLRHLMTELRWRHQKVKWGSKDYSRAIWVHPDYQVEQGNVFGPDGYKAKIQTSEFEPVEVI